MQALDVIRPGPWSPLPLIPEAEVGDWRLTYYHSGPVEKDQPWMGQWWPTLPERDDSFEQRFWHCPRPFVSQNLYLRMPLDDLHFERRQKEWGAGWARWGSFMSDIPREVHTQRYLLERCHGRVFVAGLGMGIALLLLEAMPQVESVVCLEMAADLKRLIWPHLRVPKTTLIIGDAYEYAKAFRPGSFDWAYLDTWPISGQVVQQQYIEPARFACHHLTGGDQSRILCWGEEQGLADQREYEAQCERHRRQTGLIQWADAHGVSRHLLLKQLGVSDPPYSTTDWTVDVTGLTRRSSEKPVTLGPHKALQCSVEGWC